jgi:hypothetical protein
MGISNQFFKMAMHNPKRWVPMAVFSTWRSNISCHSALETSLFQALYGHAPPSREMVHPESILVADVEELVQRRVNMNEATG